MHASENTTQGLTWEGKSVQLGDIERELNRLWEQTTATAQDKSARVRSSVLNLVVYTSSDADAEKLSETVGRLSGRHPSRAIILSAEPQHEEPSLDTAINSYCFEDPGSGAQVCCEQVLIGANGSPQTTCAASSHRCSCRTCRCICGGWAGPTTTRKRSPT